MSQHLSNSKPPPFLAGATVWEAGAYDLHVASIKTGDVVERYDLENVDQLVKVLNDFKNFLISQ